MSLNGKSSNTESGGGILSSAVIYIVPYDPTGPFTFSYKWAQAWLRKSIMDLNPGTLLLSLLPLVVLVASILTTTQAGTAYSSIGFERHEKLTSLWHSLLASVRRYLKANKSRFGKKPCQVALNETVVNGGRRTRVLKHFQKSKWGRERRKRM